MGTQQHAAIDVARVCVHEQNKHNYCAILTSDLKHTDKDKLTYKVIEFTIRGNQQIY